jgi:ketosteroid isomerase-like protein
MGELHDGDGAERCHRLFDALAAGDLDRFVAGCTEELVLTARGSDPLTTLVARSSIPAWYGSMDELAGSTFRSEVRLVLTGEPSTVVLLGHSLRRDGVEYRYETVNRCLFRGGRLASWFSQPLRADEYVRAWGIERVGERRVPRTPSRRLPVAAIP